MKIAAQKVRVKAGRMATENSNRAAPARVATGMATVQNAAPANARHTTCATRPHAQNARVQSVRAQTVRATTVPEATSSAATTINAHLRHAQKDPMQAPAWMARARMALAQKAPVTKVSALIARSVQQARARGTPSIAVRTDRVLIVHTPSVQTLIDRTPNAHIAANRTPPIVPIALVNHQAIAVANAKEVVSKIGMASARQNS